MKFFDALQICLGVTTKYCSFEHLYSLKMIVRATTTNDI